MQGRPQVALSSVLQSAPHLYDRQRLSAVERFVTVIDRLPARYMDAQVRPHNGFRDVPHGWWLVHLPDLGARSCCRGRPWVLRLSAEVWPFPSVHARWCT